MHQCQRGGRVALLALLLLGVGAATWSKPMQAQALTNVFYGVLDNKWYEFNPHGSSVVEYQIPVALIVRGSTQANCRRTNGQAMVPSSRMLSYGPYYGVVYLTGAQYLEWHTIGNQHVSVFRMTSSTGDVICDNALTADPLPSDTADLAVTLTDSVDPVTPATAFSYTASLYNGGPDIAVTPKLAFMIPPQATYSSTSGAGWSCTRAGVHVTCTGGNLAVGATSAATVHLVSPSQAGVTLNASVTASSNNLDPNQSNNSSSQTTQVSGVAASADLAIALTDSYDPVVVSTNFDYRIGVENLGPSTATQPKVTYTLPGPLTYLGVGASGWNCALVSRTLTCDRPSLGAGTRSDIVVTVRAPGSPNSITNSVSVSSVTPDQITGNNSATEATQFVYQSQSADLAIGSSNPGPLEAGDTYSYVVNVTNNGPMATTGVQVSMNLPAGAAYRGTTGSGWSCQPPQGGKVECTRTNLGNGGSAPMVVEMTAPSSAGQIAFVAQVRSARGDGNLDNNITTVTHLITGGTGGDGGDGQHIFADGFEEYRVFCDGYEMGQTSRCNPGH